MTVQGPMEGLTGAIGEELSLANGYRSTRLTTDVLKGATTFNVETTAGWPVPGTIVVDRTVYRYTGLTGGTLTGIAWNDAGTIVIGAKQNHLSQAEVLDYSQTFSVYDQTVNRIFIDTATGPALDTLGRDIGVPRAPTLEDDDKYRAVVKALAYGSKGTLRTIRQVLIALYGEGNFTLWEQLPITPCTVRVQLAESLSLLLPGAPKGRTYLDARELESINMTTLQLTLASKFQTIQSVFLANEDRHDEVWNAFPSTFTEIRFPSDAGAPVWTFAGTGGATEGGANVLHSTAFGGSTAMSNTSSGQTLSYGRTARIQTESEASLTVKMHAAPSSTSDGRCVCLSLKDGDCDACVGFVVSAGVCSAGFINPSTGAFLQGATALFSATEDATTHHAYQIRKHGRDLVEFLVDECLVQSIDRSLLTVTTLNEFRFGLLSAVGSSLKLKTLSFHSETHTDYWNAAGAGGEAIASSATFDTHSGEVLTGDVGKGFRIDGATEPGVNGNWLVASVINTNKVTLAGAQKVGAFLENGAPSRVRIAGSPRAFSYPDDVGKLIDLSQAAGSNAGTYEIAQLLDPVSFVPITGPGPVFTDSALVMGSPGFVAEAGIPWRFLPNFPAQTLLLWELAGAGAVSGQNLTLRQPIPLNQPAGYVVVVQAVFSTVSSGQLLPDNADGTAWDPFYLPVDPADVLRFYANDLTAAGIILEIVE